MDTVPSSKIAGIAHARVIEAQKHLKDVSTYSSSGDDLKAARSALSIAIELLALIAPPPVTVDAPIEPFVPVPPAPVEQAFPEAFPAEAL